MKSTTELLAAQCPGRDSNSQVTRVTGDFESLPVQSEESARFYVSQSGEVSRSLRESQPAATPTCYSLRRRVRSKRQRIADEWQRLCEAFGYRCAYCGTKPAMLHREHMSPRSRGGGEELENIVPACGPCNMGKKDLTPLEWFLVRAGVLRCAGKTYRDLRLVGDTPKSRPPHPAAWWSEACRVCDSHWRRAVIDYDDIVREMCCGCLARESRRARTVRV